MYPHLTIALAAKIPSKNKYTILHNIAKSLGYTGGPASEGDREANYEMMYFFDKHNLVGLEIEASSVEVKREFYASTDFYIIQKKGGCQYRYMQTRQDVDVKTLSQTTPEPSFEVLVREFGLDAPVMSAFVSVEE